MARRDNPGGVIPHDLEQLIEEERTVLRVHNSQIIVISWIVENWEVDDSDEHD